MGSIPDIKDSGHIQENIESSVNAESLKSTASEIEKLLSSTFSFQSRLSLNTCVKCPEPCCSVANIWYDIKDLIFINSAGIKPPDIQPRIDSDTCIYFNPASGCKIERIGRPFICNYYICSTQKKYLRRNDEKGLNKLVSVLSRVKSLRKLLEEEYLRDRDLKK